MKTIFVITMAVALAWLGWQMAGSRTGILPVTGETGILPVTRVSGILPESSSPPTTTTDPAEVFQRAFWKRPSADDKILHAERREWKDANGVTKWEWCIEVQPSPALLKHLRDDNAFGLLTGGKAAWKAPADWFPKSADGFSIMQSVSGSMTLLFSNTDGRLYATDAGGGFRPGAPAPIKPLPMQTASAGRLPNTPPPKP